MKLGFPEYRVIRGISEKDLILDIEEEWFFRDESPTHPKDVLMRALR